MEFKNQLMDDVFKQLGIDAIFSAPYHPKSNGKLEVLHRYLKPTLEKLCENDQDNWDQYINQVLTSYYVTLHFSIAETPFFLICERDPNLPLHQLLEPMQQFLSNPESGWLNFEIYNLSLAMAKKILDENRFKNEQKTRDCTPPDRVYFKNKQAEK